ncbi:hypothetical protein [Kiloniella sp. b19]|uniref:hypothetical protein n=1 Tax=Kiloniella sp. GXU_MW_B19 TaxID=3141326 RepID=UPI0031E32E36
MTELVSPSQKPLFYNGNQSAPNLAAPLNSSALSVASRTQGQAPKSDSLQDVPISAPFIAQLQEAARQEAALSKELKNGNPKAPAPESANPTAVQTAADQDENNEFGFFDFLDIINPLQHIPVVSTIYREITGDELHPTSRIFGGALYGGVPGAVSSIINAITEDTTGKDIGEHITSALFGDDEPENGPLLARNNAVTGQETARAAPTNSLPAEDLVAAVPPAPQQASTPPTATASASGSPSDSSSFAYEGQDALAALYRDLQTTRQQPATVAPGGQTEAAPGVSPASTTATEPRLAPTLAAFTQPHEQGTATARNANYFVDNGQKWFNLRQPGSNSLVNTVQVQSPSFQSTRPLLKDSVSDSVRQTVAPATASDPAIRDNTASQAASKHYQKAANQIRLSAPDDIATEMLRNLDQYEALKVNSSTLTNSL